MQLSPPTASPAPACGPGVNLERRVRTDPARPLLVWYGPGDERVELSARTFANWVDKTVNLLGELGWEDRPRVGACLVNSRPGHWTSLVWAASIWQLGGEVVVEQPVALDSLDLAVVGPDHLHPVAGLDTIACSLHPLGAGFDELASGLLDYHEVLAQPDVHTPAVEPESSAPAWSLAERVVSHAELAAAAPTAGRVVVAATGPAFEVVRASLVAPLAGGGSAVVVEGDVSDQRLRRIAEAEKAELAQ